LRKMKRRKLLRLTSLAMLLLVYLIVGLLILEGWGNMPINKLPVPFWSVYVVFLVAYGVSEMLSLQAMQIRFAASQQDTRILPRPKLLIYFAALFVLAIPMALDWDGMTLMFFTIALLFLLSVALRLTTRNLVNKR
jgi:hypothetical protein